jgi:site-specific recombinase XerD
MTEPIMAKLPNSYPEMQNDLRVFKRWLRGRKISKENIIRFLSWALKSRSASTVARYKTSIKAKIREGKGLKMTQREQIVLDSFFYLIKIPKRESRIVETKIVSPKERRKIKMVSGKKTGLLIQALYESGARVSEMLGLKIADCNACQDFTYCNVLGKGKKKRTVYLKTETYQEIRMAYRSSIFLFESPQNKPISRLTAHTLLRRAGKKAGRRMTPHMLRHSRATDLLNAGHSLASVSAYLGHSSPDVTAKFYLHGMPSAKRVMTGL